MRSAFAYSDSNGHRNGRGYSHGYSHDNSHRYSDGNCYSNTYTNTNTEANSHTKTSPNTAATAVIEVHADNNIALTPKAFGHLPKAFTRRRFNDLTL